MARENKKLTPEELSAIRRAANAKRKTFGAGGNYRTVDPLSKSCTIRTSKWAADVFAAAGFGDDADWLRDWCDGVASAREDR